MVYSSTSIQGWQWLISFMNDWNPNCLTFEQNEKSMPGHNGDLNHPDWRSYPPMKVENVAKDISECASITIEKWSEAIDINICSTFANLSHILTPGTKLMMLLSLVSERGDTKVFAPIGSCSIANDSLQCSLFDGPVSLLTILKLLYH